MSSHPPPNIGLELCQNYAWFIEFNLRSQAVSFLAISVCARDSGTRDDQGCGFPRCRESHPNQASIFSTDDGYKYRSTLFLRMLSTPHQTSR